MNRHTPFEEYNEVDLDSELHGSLEDYSRSKGGKFNQFEVNKSKFGVVSTYDNDLYTTKLDKDEFYKKHEAIANEIEKEIVNQPTKNKHMEEERGILADADPEENEEFKFSGVYKVEVTHEKSSPIMIERPHASPGNSPSLMRKGRGSGANSPKVGSPLEKSMKQLNLDCPSPTFSERQQDKFNDFLQKEKDLERKKVTDDLKSFKLNSDKKLKPKKSEEEPAEEIKIPELNPDADAFDPFEHGLMDPYPMEYDQGYYVQPYPMFPPPMTYIYHPPPDQVVDNSRSYHSKSGGPKRTNQVPRGPPMSHPFI